MPTRSRSFALILAAASLALAAPSVASAAPAPQAPSAGVLASIVAAQSCSSVSYGGRTYVMYRRGVSCGFARYWVRRLHYARRGPRGWRCSSGTGYRTGGGCYRGSRRFGWHPGD